MSPNAYYNYLKDRKKEYRKRVSRIQKRIVAIYHQKDGVPGYRQMKQYLVQEDVYISELTCHHYMHALGLKSIVCPRKPAYVKEIAHTIFPNILNQQFMAENFTDFCKKNHIQQSMSRAGCPYANAPMERFYNILKNEYFYLRNFKDVESLNVGIYQFIYGKYNRKRPHSYNGGLTPYAVRMVA